MDKHQRLQIAQNPHSSNPTSSDVTWGEVTQDGPLIYECASPQDGCQFVTHYGTPRVVQVGTVEPFTFPAVEGIRIKKRSCQTLTLHQKLAIIREVDIGGKKKKVIAAEHGIPASTLSTIIKHRESILQSFGETSFSQERKRARASNYPDVEEAMVTWLRCTRDLNLQVSGPILQEKAEQFGDSLGHRDFKASIGWLKRFQCRNGIIQKVACGNDDCDEWKSEVLPNLMKVYDTRDIFTADETSLLYKAFPDKTLALRYEECLDGQRAEDRLTVLLAANMRGNEKLKLLVIGSSRNPPCFSKMKSLPVIYESDARSWMTGTVFQSWLRAIDRKFSSENRKVLLFVDNNPAHQKIQVQELSAVQVVFFPPNMLSRTQPACQGVVQNLKYCYRKRTVKKVLSALDKGEEAELTLLDYLFELTKAWDDVRAETVAYCFRKAGFHGAKEDEKEEEDDPEEEDHAFPLEWSTFQKVTMCAADFDEYVNVDGHLRVSEYPSEEDIVHSVRGIGESVIVKIEEEEGEYECPAVSPPTLRGAINAMEVVRSYVMSKANVEDRVFRGLNAIDDFFMERQRKRTRPTYLRHM